MLGFCWAVFETFSWVLQVNQRPRRTGSQSSTQTGILRKWALEAWTKNSQIFSEELLLLEFSHLKLWSKWVSVACRSVAGAQGAGLALACEGWTQLAPLWCCSFWRIQQTNRASSSPGAPKCILDSCHLAGEGGQTQHKHSALECLKEWDTWFKWILFWWS